MSSAPNVQRNKKFSSHITSRLSHFKSHLSHFAFPISNRGFSLIELLVVVAIIGLLSSGAIAAYNNFNQAQVVRRAALKLKSDLRESQNRATSGVKNQACKQDIYDADPLTSLPPPDTPDNIEDYGLKGHFVIFNTNVGETDHYSRAQMCSPTAGQEFPFVPGDIIPVDSQETIDLPPSVTLLDVRVLNPSTGNPCADPNAEPSILTINFTALKGVDFFSGSDPNSTPINDPSCLVAEITLTDGTTEYTVTVNKSGQIVEKRLP